MLINGSLVQFYVFLFTSGHTLSIMRNEAQWVVVVYYE